jgi:hypothetical protein
MVGASSERCREHTSATRHKKTVPLSEVGVTNTADPDRISRDSVAVMLELVRPLHWHIDLGGLLGAELGELGAELLEVESGYQLIEVHGQHVDLLVDLGTLSEQLDLRRTWLVKEMLIAKLGWPAP